MYLSSQGMSSHSENHTVFSREPGMGFCTGGGQMTTEKPQWIYSLNCFFDFLPLEKRACMGTLPDCKEHNQAINVDKQPHKTTLARKMFISKQPGPLQRWHFRKVYVHSSVVFAYS